MTFSRVCAADEIPDGKLVSFWVEDMEVLLVHAGGALRAYDGICPHESFALVDGVFDGQTITCIGHQWMFSAANGRGVNPPNCKLEAFPVKVEDGDVYVDLDP